MDKTLLNRIPRKLKANLGRYIALTLMVAISAYCLVSICGSAATLIQASLENSEQAAVEDGEFICLDPLSDDELKTLKDGDVTVEDAFYLDFTQDDESVVRVFALRENIDLVSVDEGGDLPADGEIVLERNYANEKNLGVGDTIDINGQTFTISGLCTSPDYETMLRNLTDPAARSDLFGTAFITYDTYNALYKKCASDVTQSYLYLYRLGDGMTNDELIEYISSLKFDALTAQNSFIRKKAYDQTSEQRDLEDGITGLSTGSTQLKDAITQLQQGLESLQSGATDATSSTSSAADMASQLAQAASSLSSGAKRADEILDSLGGLDNVVVQMDSLADFIDLALDNYPEAISTLDSVNETLSTYEDEKIQNICIMLQTLRDQLESSQSQMQQARDGIDKARKAIDDATAGVGNVSEIAGNMTSKMSSLASGLTAFSEAITNLDSSVSELPDYLDTAVDSNSQILNGMAQLSEGVDQLQQRADELTERVFDSRVNKVSQIVSRADNPRIDAMSEDQMVIRAIGMVLGILLFILISYVLSVFVSHSIEEERSIIGALYALGVSRWQVLLNYVMLPVVLAFIGGVIGTAIGLSPIGTTLQMDIVEAGFSAPHITGLPPAWVLICGIVLPPLVAAIVNVLVLFRKLNLPVLDLLNRREASARTFNLAFIKKFNFTHTFQVRRLIRERGIELTIFLGMFAAMLLVMVGVDCHAMCNNLIDDSKTETTWNYLYTYLYPADEVPEGGTAVFMESLTIGEGDDAHTVELVGTTSGNPYYDVNPTVGKNKCTISSALAKKFDLKVGSKLVMTNSVTNVDYAFTVDNIVTHESSLYAFMDIESMRELFNKDSSYYNVVMASDELDIDAQTLYSTVTYDDVQLAAQQFYDSIRLRIILLMALPVVLFAVIMYLMLMVIIDRAALGISLLKIFGYEEGLVRKLYLRMNTVLVAIFALIEIPVSKMIIDAIYSKVMTSSVVTGRFDLNPLIYVVVFFAVMLIYTLVNKLLLRRVNKITPSDVLRNR